MDAQLIPSDGSPPVPLKDDVILIGRGPECDLILPQKIISKLHCILLKTDGLLLLRDLGSINGTRVNGRRVRRAALLPNDVLGLASLKFRVHYGTGPLLSWESATGPVDLALSEMHDTTAEDPSDPGKPIARGPAISVPAHPAVEPAQEESQNSNANRPRRDPK